MLIGGRPAHMGRWGERVRSGGMSLLRRLIRSDDARHTPGQGDGSDPRPGGRPRPPRLDRRYAPRRGGRRRVSWRAPVRSGARPRRHRSAGGIDRERDDQPAGGTNRLQRPRAARWSHPQRPPITAGRSMGASRCGSRDRLDSRGSSRNASTRRRLCGSSARFSDEHPARPSGCRGSRRSPASTRALLLRAARRRRGAARSPLLARGTRASLAMAPTRAGRALRRRVAVGAWPSARGRWFGPVLSPQRFEEITKPAVGPRPPAPPAPPGAGDPGACARPPLGRSSTCSW
jgi:hypothetical protein